MGAGPRQAGGGKAWGSADPNGRPLVSYLAIFLEILDSRSFASLWYWLGLALIWTLMTRNALGVPSDVVMRSRREAKTADQSEDNPELARLLTWLTVSLPRWHINARDGAVLAAIACFVLTVLGVLGFRHGYEAAQALTLLLAPLALVLLLRIRLARRLDRLMQRMHTGEVSPHRAATEAAHALTRHGWLVFALSLVAIALAASIAALWIGRHPFGY